MYLYIIYIYIHIVCIYIYSSKALKAAKLAAKDRSTLGSPDHNCTRTLLGPMEESRVHLYASGHESGLNVALGLPRGGGSASLAQCPCPEELTPSPAGRPGAEPRPLPGRISGLV